MLGEHNDGDCKNKQEDEPLKWDREWWLLRNNLSEDKNCSLPYNTIKIQCTSGQQNNLCSYF